MMYDYGMHGWAMALGWLIPVGLIAIFFYLANGRKTYSVKEILDRRYAKGEIDTKEYRERLKELGFEGGDDNPDA